MQVICQYSGVTFEVPNFRNLKVQGIHPLMYQPIKILLSRAGDWAAGKLTSTESRILFTALLKYTDLVEFKVPVGFRTNVDTLNTHVQANMEALLKVCGWNFSTPAFVKVLPSFSINEDTCDLGNISRYIGMWFEARDAYYDGFKKANAAERLEFKEQALERLIRSSMRDAQKEGMYRSRLADWALEAGGFPRETEDDKIAWDQWKSFFMLQGMEIHHKDIRLVDLEDLLHYLELNLIHKVGSTHHFAALKLIREIVKRKTKGILAEIDDDVVFYDEDENSTNIQNSKLIAAGAPVVEPKEAQYTSKLEYLKAKAAWNVKIRMQDRDTELASRLEKDLSQADLDSSMLGEEDEEQEDISDILPKENGDRDE